MLANVHALAASHSVGVFGFYSDSADREADADGFSVRVSRRFTPDVIARLGPTSLEWLRRSDGHPSDRWYSDGVMSELSSFVRELGASVIVVESLWLHRYIAPLRGVGCRVVLDAHGLESMLHDELAASASNPLAYRFAERTSRIEIAAFRACDQVWIPSHREAELARAHGCSEVPLVVVPNVIEPERYGPAERRDSKDFVVIFPAAFGALPNANASRRLLERIFPALRERVPNARLALVGRDPTARMRAAADDDDRVEVTGRVNDITAFLRRASVMAVPLSEGHGTRFKVLEAFASGLPVISTQKGVEGIDADAGEHYLPAESDEEFVGTLVSLAQNPELGARLATSALELVRERYSLASLRQVVTEALAMEAVR